MNGPLTGRFERARVRVRHGGAKATAARADEWQLIELPIAKNHFVQSDDAQLSGHLADLSH